jgi:hypothetical protein
MDDPQWISTEFQAENDCAGEDHQQNIGFAGMHWSRKESQSMNVCPLESPPGQGEWPKVVRHLLLLKKRSHFRTSKSLRNNENIVKARDEEGNRNLLRWLGPTAIYLSDRANSHPQGVSQNVMEICISLRNHEIYHP